MKMRLGQTNRRIRVRRPRHKRYDPRYVLGVSKYEPRSRMYWGAISWKGPGLLFPIEGTEDAEEYCSVLAKGVRASAAKLKMERFIFQDDNSSSHRAEAVKKFKENEKIPCIPRWPSNSPDLNPIEVLWAELKNRIRRRSPRTVAEMERVAIEEWDKIPRVFIQKRIRLIPIVISAIIKVHGDVTPY